MRDHNGTFSPTDALLLALEEHRLTFLFFAQPKRRNPATAGGWDILDRDARPEYRIPTEDIDAEGQFLFDHRWTLDLFAETAISRFGSGEGAKPTALTRDGKCVEVEGGSLPLWSLDEVACLHLEHSSNALVAQCRSFREQDHEGRMERLAEQVLGVTHDEGQARWYSPNLVRWEYLSRLDAAISAVKKAGALLPRRKSPADQDAAQMSQGQDEPVSAAHGEDEAEYYLIASIPAGMKDSSGLPVSESGEKAFCAVHGRLEAAALCRLFTKEYGDVGEDFSPPPDFSFRASADLTPEDRVLWDEAIDELRQYTFDPDPGIYDPAPSRLTMVLAGYLRRAEAWESRLTVDSEDKNEMLRKELFADPLVWRRRENRWQREVGQHAPTSLEEMLAIEKELTTPIPEKVRSRFAEVTDMMDNLDAADDMLINAIKNGHKSDPQAVPEDAPPAEPVAPATPGKSESAPAYADLCTAIGAAVAMRNLGWLCYYYPNDVEEKEANELRSALSNRLTKLLQGPGFEKIWEGCNKKDFCQLYEKTGPGILVGILMLWHPDVSNYDNGKMPSTEWIDAAMTTCLERAAEPVKKMLSRISEIEVVDCRIPHPADDPSFLEPGRFVRLLREYWELCKDLIFAEMDAKISFQPHPLMPLIVNLRLRLEVCFEKLVAFSGTAEAREIAFGLLDILVSSEPDDLQVVPEWTRGEVNKVEMFIEQCRYAAKSKPYELTPAEKACIRAAQVGTAEHRGRLKEAWANCLRNLDRQKPLPRASVPQAPEHHDEKAPSSTSTGPLAPSAEKSVVSPAQATQGPSSPVMPRERCEHSEDYCSVIWFGTRYEFTKTQAACIKCLWAEWEKGGLALAEETIGEKAGSASESFRLFHTFRMKAKSKMTKRVGKTNVHIVWGTMIVPAGKGKFRLEAPKKRQITR